MKRREFCNVWARYATTAFGLIYPTTDALAFADALTFADEPDDEKPDPRFNRWPLVGRVMNGPLPLTGFFPLRNDQYELKIGKMRECHITAMHYKIKIDGNVFSINVDVTNPQFVDPESGNVIIRFQPQGIISVHGYEP